MVAIKEAQTLTRVAIFNSCLEEAVKRFNPECAQIRKGLGNSIKFGLYDKQRMYLLIVSQQIERKISRVHGIDYNTELTVTSRDSDLNESVAREFQDKTGINFTEAPEIIAQMMQNIGASFFVFEKYGKRAMDFLKGF